MNEAKWEKVAAATGIGAIVLYVVSYALTGAPPSGANAAKVLQWATDKREAVLQAGFVSGLAMVLYIWFLGSLRSYLRSAEGGSGRLSAVVFGAGVVTVALTALTTILSTMAVMRLPQAGDPAIAQLLNDGVSASIAVGWPPLAAMMGATAVITMRKGAFPAWFGALGYVGAIASLLASLGVATATGAFSSSGAVGMLAFALAAVWMLVASVLLIQRVGKPVAA